MSGWKEHESFDDASVDIRKDEDNDDLDADARLSTKPDFLKVDRGALGVPAGTPSVAIAVYVAGQLEVYCLALFSYYSLKEGLANANLADTVKIAGSQLVNAAGNLRDATLTRAVLAYGPALYNLRTFSEQDKGQAKDFATAFATLTSTANYRARIKQKFGDRFAGLVESLWQIAKSPGADKKPPKDENTPISANNLVHAFKWAAIALAYHLSGDGTLAYRNYASANIAAFRYQH